ncbi:diphthine methyl ester synthase-like isoform X2 [Hylaeus volcanicus]|uniref:diphthine methyl ester synthase-like isoform X2 n=1 Tax=Hylaeus volcanicus TaxID=313075 RepID=UPI0023B8604C|nr:diphthine methyl ester synthase-like isoform X2 [Hylaeus volcanicus]
MALYLIGLGLYDEKDISLRAFEIIKSASYIYLECYTSILFCDKDRLETFYGREIQSMDRESVESKCDHMLEQAKTSTVVLLVVGDPLCATTHSDLLFRAKTLKIKTYVIHNASMINAVSSCGLQVYLFGEVVSIPFFTENWIPESVYEKIQKNMLSGLHTLCLLDIKVKEQTVENLMLQNSIYEPPKFMTIPQAIDQLFSLENTKKQMVCQPHTKAFGMARIGNLQSQLIVSGTLEELQSYDFGPPLHSLVICSPKLHDMEEAFYNLHNIRFKSILPCIDGNRQ